MIRFVCVYEESRGVGEYVICISDRDKSRLLWFNTFKNNNV